MNELLVQLEEDPNAVFEMEADLPGKGQLTHEQLCERARRWLSGSRRCEPVFSNIASCAEIPDAIGWASCLQWQGSTVIECKTSRSDFYADKKKYQYYAHPEDEIHPGWMRYSLSRMTAKFARDHGYVLNKTARMGDFRYFLCEPGIITLEMLDANAPDHGLLYIKNARSLEMVRKAPRRTELVDKDGEIRYLRFAIINRKQPFQFAETGDEYAVIRLVPRDPPPARRQQTLEQPAESSLTQTPTTHGRRLETPYTRL